ncbi:bifunctional oligoribonuclease/PAP phosphatase NrnA [Geobacter sp. DSM 9736]|uniref:DHH family phosphoesterase n=1 Tax=Geobacter sp. DSM 9736 TaxID=1277350 RepID=UPI000B4FE507|nr:DHH family phosphoesterase [Geobacter sp. DSM 9736]SNB45159.1 nanoRNase/pAp phosphatase, hydrolyzes c-di-AMP and oligoRNAs [Geobacter sp. DSM 9736]
MTSELIAKSRKFTDDLLVWLRGRGKILIIVHDNPDPDCLASAMALRHLFVMKLNRDATIAFSGMIGRSENLAMAKKLEIPLTPFALIDISDYQVICMLDTQPATGNNSLPPGVKVDIVIDHHPPRPATQSSRWADIRDEYGVTATILYEYLQAQEVIIGTKLATALFYAIRSETQDLGREANQPDREAYLRLFPLTNKKLLYEISYPKLPIEYFLTINSALEHSRIYGPLLVMNLQEIIFPEVVAEMADFLIRLEDIETVLSMGQYSNEMILSIRTIRHDLNAGEIIRSIVDGMGAAGGHGMMAGGKIDNVPADRDVIERVERELTKRLLQALGMEQIRSRDLIGKSASRH